MSKHRKQQRKRSRKHLERTLRTFERALRDMSTSEVRRLAALYSKDARRSILIQGELYWRPNY